MANFTSLLTNKTFTFTDPKPLGGGAFGTVTQYTTPEGKNVAVKMVEDEDHIDSMIREVVMLKALKSEPQYVVNVLDVVTKDGLLGMVYDVADMDLWAYIKKGGVSLFDKKKILYQIALSVAHTQSRGILNGDYKPSNILMHGDRPVLADFGIAKTIKEFPSRQENFTRFWRPPEILLEGRYIPASDVWALGIMICDVVLEKLCFAGDSEIDQLYKYFREFGTPGDSKPEGNEWPGMTKLNGYRMSWPRWLPNEGESSILHRLPPGSKELVKKMMRYDPSTRITVDQVISDPWFDDVRAVVTTPIPPLPDLKNYTLTNQFPLAPPPAPTEEIRGTVVRWMQTVCHDFRISDLQTAMAIAIFDESRRGMAHTRFNIQCMGCASIYLSSILVWDSLDIEDLVRVTNNGVSKEKINKAVYEVAVACSFDLLRSTSYDVAKMYFVSYDLSQDIRAHAIAILQLSYGSILSSECTPEEVAVKCIAIAKMLTGQLGAYYTRQVASFQRRIYEAVKDVKRSEVQSMGKHVDMVNLIKMLGVEPQVVVE